MTPQTPQPEFQQFQEKLSVQRWVLKVEVHNINGLVVSKENL